MYWPPFERLCQCQLNPCDCHLMSCLYFKVFARVSSRNPIRTANIIRASIRTAPAPGKMVHIAESDTSSSFTRSSADRSRLSLDPHGAGSEATGPSLRSDPGSVVKPHSWVDREEIANVQETSNSVTLVFADLASRKLESSFVFAMVASKEIGLPPLYLPSSLFLPSWPQPACWGRGSGLGWYPGVLLLPALCPSPRSLDLRDPKGFWGGCLSRFFCYHVSAMTQQETQGSNSLSLFSLLPIPHPYPPHWMIDWACRYQKQHSFLPYWTFSLFINLRTQKIYLACLSSCFCFVLKYQNIYNRWKAHQRPLFPTPVGVMPRGAGYKSGAPTPRLSSASTSGTPLRRSGTPNAPFWCWRPTSRSLHYVHYDDIYNFVFYTLQRL